MYVNADYGHWIFIFMYFMLLLICNLCCEALLSTGWGGDIVRPDDDDDDDDADWKKVIEQIFQDRDGGDSDVEVGYDESITEDVVGDEEPNLLTLTADDGELQDDLNANDMSTLRCRWQSVGRLDAFWSWEKCDNQRIQPPKHTVTQPEEIRDTLPNNPSPNDYFKLYVTGDQVDLMVLDTNDVQALSGKEYEVAFVRLVLRRYQRWWMNLKTNYHREYSEIHRCLNDRRCSYHLPVFCCLSHAWRAEKTS